MDTLKEFEQENMEQDMEEINRFLTQNLSPARSLRWMLTGLSISALATNMRLKGGGAYFMLSRSFGAEAGAALGIPLALSQTVAVTFYVAGFAEALTRSGLPVVSACDPRLVG